MLTNRQKRFVEEYLIDFDCTQAAIRAGYSQNTAENYGKNNLKKPEIISAVQEGIIKNKKSTKITKETVIDELARIAFADISDFVRVETRKQKDGAEQEDEVTLFLKAVETKDLTKEQTAAIASIKETRYGVCVELYDKFRALNLLGQYLGMFNAKNTESYEENTSLTQLINEAYTKRREVEE